MLILSILYHFGVKRFFSWTGRGADGSEVQRVQKVTVAAPPQYEKFSAMRVQ